MDLSTILQPLITLVNAAVANGRSQARSNTTATAVLDRSLGTVTSIGLTIAAYRLLKLMRTYSKNSPVDENDERSDNTDYESNKGVFYTLRMLVRILIREIFRGEGVKLIESDAVRKNNVEELSFEKRLYHGSCHCKSISFTLSAPNHIRAKSSREGKMRFPNCSTTANDFKFTNGTEFLSVYYVKIPIQKCSTRVDAIQALIEKQVAAHTFCSRCGVHILRAPDNRSNALEINTNCLDDFHDDKGDRIDGLKLTVSFDVDIDERGVGSGLAVKNQWSKDEIDEDEVDTLYDDDSLATNKSLTTNKSSKYRPDTPRSQDTTITAGDTLFSSSSSVRTSHTTGILYDDDTSRASVLQTMKNSDTFGSMPPETPTISTPRSTVSSPVIVPGGEFTTSNGTHSLVMREQLKYYMEKHITPQPESLMTIRNGIIRKNGSKD